MKSVGITIEVAYRKYVEVDLSEMDYNLLANGDVAPLYEMGLINDIENGNPEIDYEMTNEDQEAFYRKD